MLGERFSTTNWGLGHGCFVCFLAEETQLGLNSWKERRRSNFLTGMYAENLDILQHFQLLSPKFGRLNHCPRPACLLPSDLVDLLTLGFPGRTTVDPETSSSVTTGDALLRWGRIAWLWD